MGAPRRAARGVARAILFRRTPVPSPVDLALLKRLEDAVAKLPPLTREVFLAHRVQTLSYEQIAERNGLTVRGVERHIASAICQLDKLLDARKARWWERWF